jgi:hypothetical protein
MKVTIESDISEVVHDTRSDTEKAKATTDMERIISFIKNEPDGLERRIAGTAKKMDRSV